MKKIYYAKASYGKEEVKAVNKVLKNSMELMNGRKVREFEKNVAKLFGKKFGLMVNSGSSANLIALQSLNLKNNSEIITPLLTFSTTVAPIYHSNLLPRFIDVDLNKYIATPDVVEKSINKNTKAIYLPNLLGNIPDWNKIYEIAKKYNLKVVEDSADTIGYKIKNYSGSFSDVVTTSFYASHVVTGAGFGGMVCFNDKKLYNRALLLRSWGRSSAIINENENIKKRFSKKLDGIEYDSKYIFENLGYNFIPSEISAAFGLEQLKKLKINLRKRKKNFNFLKNYIQKNLSNFFYVPEENLNTKTAWLAFPLLIKNYIKINRKKLQIFLEKNLIQTRTIFSGNITKHPMMKNRNYKIVKKPFYNADYIMKNGILIGCHNSMTKKELNFICSKINQFVNNQ